MTPYDFITKWHNSLIKERAGAQPHFLDLCRMLSEPEPADLDATGRDYGFEVGANKTTVIKQYNIVTADLEDPVKR